MKTNLYLATAHGLNVIEGSNGTWLGEARLQGQPAQCVAVDSGSKERVHCGTFGIGVYRSDDAGANWRPCKGLPNQPWLFAAELREGTAIRLLTSFERTVPILAVRPASRRMSTKVRIFIEHLENTFTLCSQFNPRPA